MGWVSPKVYAILKNSEEGKDILEGIADKDQDQVDKEVNEFFGKGGKGYKSSDEYSQAKLDEEAEKEHYKSIDDEETDKDYDEDEENPNKEKIEEALKRKGWHTEVDENGYDNGDRIAFGDNWGEATVFLDEDGGDDCYAIYQPEDGEPEEQEFDSIEEAQDWIESKYDGKDNDFYSRDNIMKRQRKITDAFEMPEKEGWKKSEFGEKSFIKNEGKDNEMFIQYNGADYDGDNQEWVAGYMKNGEYVSKKFTNMEDAKDFIKNSNESKSQVSDEELEKKMGSVSKLLGIAQRAPLDDDDKKALKNSLQKLIDMLG